MSVQRPVAHDIWPGRSAQIWRGRCRAPVLIVETTLGEAPLDPAVRYLKTKFPGSPAWQIHAEGSKDYQTPEGIRVAPAPVLLRTLV
jgi:hypothetical protein